MIESDHAFPEMQGNFRRIEAKALAGRRMQVAQRDKILHLTSTKEQSHAFFRQSPTCVLQNALTQVAQGASSSS